MTEKSASPQAVAKPIPLQPSPLTNETTLLKLSEPESALDQIHRLHEAIARRAYELFERAGALHGHDADHWFQAESELLRHIHINVSDSDGSTLVRAETPGFKAEDLQVSLEGRQLTIYGKKELNSEQKTPESSYQELSTSETFRTVELSEDVDASKATATLKNGVLELVLPKASAAKNQSRPAPLQSKAATSGAS